MRGNLYYWVADWSLSRTIAAQRLHDNVVDMVDCTHRALPTVRGCFGVIKMVGGYITGSSDIAWTSTDFSSLPHDVTALSIDQSNLDLPLLSKVKQVVKDEETGASTIQVAVHVASERLLAGDDYVIYCDAHDLPSVEHSAEHLGMFGQIIAYQWASPTSNPSTILPGTSLTLSQANADLSVVSKSYLATLSPPPVVHHLAQARVSTITDLRFDENNGVWVVTSSKNEVTPLPWGS